MSTPQRIDFHVHSFFSDGVLLPSEILRRASQMGHRALAITDHADASNLEELVLRLVRFSRLQERDFPLQFLVGVELTHVAPSSIAKLAHRARELGADIVVVHGETPVEPVRPGTNRAALECSEVDLLAHPGFITPDEALLAVERDIILEITSRRGHSLTNGHVALTAQIVGAKLVVNTDTHDPADLITQEMAQLVAAGAGLPDDQVEAATVIHPGALLDRLLRRRLRQA
jgi:putative hydrolase